jgi:hypothetical protein
MLRHELSPNRSLSPLSTCDIDYDEIPSPYGDDAPNVYRCLRFEVPAPFAASSSGRLKSAYPMHETIVLQPAQHSTQPFSVYRLSQAHDEAVSGTELNKNLPPVGGKRYF